MAFAAWDKSEKRGLVAFIQHNEYLPIVVYRTIWPPRVSLLPADAIRETDYPPCALDPAGSGPNPSQ